MKPADSRRISSRAKKWKAFAISHESALTQLEQAERLWKSPRASLLASCMSEAVIRLRYVLKARKRGMRAYYTNQAILSIHHLRALNALQRLQGVTA